ncbi:hypothetical protein [Enhygromyxa salina]|uniref:hypothetical protein n=1 Tax=Enhygromyxa salina TaxID=215803 RepID=UPI0011B258AB|nr:hypothetical protein [Enhygromyxa salina]
MPGSALAAPAASSAGSPAPIEAQLEIDTTRAGAGADVLRRRIEERANIALRHAKVLPGDRDDLTLAVSVEEIGGDAPGYILTFELHAADGSMLDEPTEHECSLCTETELVARVEAELEPMIAALRAIAESSDEPDQADPPPLEPGPEGAPIDAPPPSHHAGMLAGGITLLVLGTGSLGAAVGLIVPKPKIDEDNPLDLITTRPVGYALLAGGLACAVTGAVLTAIAAKQRRQARLSLAPFGDRHSAGLSVGWRLP